MVYESDFYTTRRPYSRPSPTITSYSVTDSLQQTNDDVVAFRNKETRFKSADRKSKYSNYFEPNLSETSDDSDIEGDLADPYGPYGRFAKYLKPEKKSPVKFSKKDSAPPKPPKRVSSRKNGDWQNKLRFSDGIDNYELADHAKGRLGLNKMLFSPEKDGTKSLSERYGVRAYERNERINVHTERNNVETREIVKLDDVDTGKTLLENVRDSERKRSPLSFTASEVAKPIPAYNKTVKSFVDNLSDDEKSFDEILEKFRIGPYLQKAISLAKDSNPCKSTVESLTDNLGSTRRSGYDYSPSKICDVDSDKKPLVRYLSPDGGPNDNLSTTRSGYKKYNPRKISDVDSDEKLSTRYLSPDDSPNDTLSTTRRSGYKKYSPSKISDADSDEKRSVRYLSPDDSSNDTLSTTRRSGYKKYNPSKLSVVGSDKKRLARYLSPDDSPNDTLSTSRRSGYKKYSSSKISDADSDKKRLVRYLSPDDAPNDNLGTTRRSGYKKYNPRNISNVDSDEKLSARYLSPDDSPNDTLSTTRRSGYKKYIPSKISDADSDKKRLAQYLSPDDEPNDNLSTSRRSACKYSTISDGDFQKKRSSQYLFPNDSDDDNKENIWKNATRPNVFSPVNTIKTLSSDSASFKGDSRTKWTSSPDVRGVKQFKTKCSRRADEGWKNFRVRSFSSLEKDLNDAVADSVKHKPKIEKGPNAKGIDNLDLDVEKKRVGHESPNAKGSDKIGRYNTSSGECIDHDEISQTTDSEEKAPPAHYLLPYVAVKRLTLPQAAPPRSKVRNSVLMAEIDRINHRVRPALGFSAVEHYLNSRLALSRKYGKRQYHMSLRSDVEEESFDSCRKAILAMREKVDKKEIPLSAMVNFDDETRMIRAQTAALLKSVHTPLPRSRPLILPTPSALMETPIPNRITSDAYIHGLLMPLSKVHTDVASRSFYVENPRPYIGKGHLACVSFAGGRAYAKRHSHIDDKPIHPRNVKNDIETLSFYSRARAVAKGEEPGPEPKAVPRKSRAYRPNTDAAREPAPRPRPAPARQESVKEVAPPPAKETPAEEPLAAPVTNGINGVEEDPELARLAEEEAELARMEAELAAQQTKKKKPKKQASEDADKAAEEASKKAAAEAEAAKKAEEEEEAKKQAELEAEIERQVAAELAAEEAKKKEAELEAEIERQVAEELAAEEAKKKEAELEAEIERQVAEELAAEEARKKEAELEAEIERQVAAELAAEEESKQQEEAEPEVSNQKETDKPEPESEPEPEVEHAEVENEPENKSEGDPEPLSEAADDEPVIDEPLSQAEQDKSANFWETDDDAAKVDEIDPLPED